MDEEKSIVAHGSRNEEIPSKFNPRQQKCKRRCTSDLSETKDSKRMCCRDNSEVIVDDNKDHCSVINRLTDVIVEDNQDDCSVIDKLTDVIVEDSQDDCSVIDKLTDVIVEDNQDDCSVIDKLLDVIVEDNQDDCSRINKLPSSIVIKIFKELTLEDRLLRVS